MTAAPAPRILGVDAATPRAGLALLAGDAVVAEIAFQPPVSPSRALLPGLRFLLELAGWELTELELYAVTVGPGSFTGIRVGLSTVRGLAMATGRPVAGVSTLEAMASMAGSAPWVAPWLDAGRGEVYAGLLQDGQTRWEQVASPEAVLGALPPEPVVFVGSGADRWAARIHCRPGAHRNDRIVAAPPPVAAAAARVARAAAATGALRPPIPRYLRPPDATRARA